MTIPTPSFPVEPSLLLEACAEEPLEQPTRVLWVGDTALRELAPIHAELASLAELDLLQLDGSPTIADAVSLLGDARTDGDAPPGYDLVLLACPRPIADPAPAKRLLEACGDTPAVQLLGVWCEGEGRTGHPIEGWRRVFWHAWPAWWRTQSLVGGVTTGSLKLNSGTLVVRSPDAESADAIGEALAEHRWGVVWAPPGRHTAPRLAWSNPSAGVWVGKQLSGVEADDLARFCRRLGQSDAPVIALLDFPRPETAAAARALGAAAVLGKPYDHDALLDTLGRTLAERRTALHVLNEWCDDEPAAASVQRVA